jgi:hypothetical protein
MTSNVILSLERAWSANFKMVWYILLRPLRPQPDGQDPFQIMESCVECALIEKFIEFIEIIIYQIYRKIAVDKFDNFDKRIRYFFTTIIRK